jgi:hypothetical protein
MAETPAPLQWLSAVGVPRLAAAWRTLPTSCSHPAACVAVFVAIAVAVLLGLATGRLHHASIQPSRSSSSSWGTSCWSCAVHALLPHTRTLV